MKQMDKQSLWVMRTLGYRIRQEARKKMRVRPYRGKKDNQTRARMKQSGRIVYGAAAEGAIRRGTAELEARSRGSSPGEPPLAHEREALRKIYYAWDSAKRVEVIGPTLFAGKKGSKGVPELHEKGGTTTVNGKPARYPPRPFMRPALAAKLPELPELWKASSLRF